MPIAPAIGPAIAAGASTGPFAPIAIPISILLSALGLGRLFGGRREEGPRPYGVEGGENTWTINPGDPWYGQPIDPNTGLHQSIVDQIWNMAPPEGLPESLLASNSSLGIPNWSALRLQRVAWELGGWDKLVNVLKSEPNVGNLPDWLTSRMSWGFNPVEGGTQGGVPIDMSDWLTFSTTVFGRPWGLIIDEQGNTQTGEIPEGQEPDYIDPASGMPVFSTTVTELPGELPTPETPEPEFPGPPPSDRMPEEPGRGGRLPRFVVDVSEILPPNVSPQPQTPNPPPMGEFPGPPVEEPPVIPPVIPVPNLPPPEFPGPPVEGPPVEGPPVETPPPVGAGANLPNIPAVAAALGGAGLGGGPAIPPPHPVIGGGNPYQTLFGLPIPHARQVPSLAMLLGR